MEPQRRGRRDQGLTAMDGAIALIAVLLIVQMWVLTASLESFLAGHRKVVLPAAIVSGVIFLGSWLLYRFIARVDREASDGE